MDTVLGDMSKTKKQDFSKIQGRFFPPLSLSSANVDEVMTRCFEQMFAEGPGGGHYDNMTSRRYSQVFCGFADLGGGTFWVNQDFR